MHKYRMRHPDYVPATARKVVAKPDLDVGDDTETALKDSAEDIYSVSAKHRETVKRIDAAAAIRRRKARRV